MKPARKQLETAPLEMHVFGEKSGGRRRTIKAREGVDVTIDPVVSDADRQAAEVAESIRLFLSGQEQFRQQTEWRAIEAEEKCERLQKRVEQLEALVPPPSPVRVFNGGCVRFDDKGRLHLMNQREKGWASFSIIVDGWDDLFRRYAVRIGKHGTDESGAYWLVIPEVRS